MKLFFCDICNESIPLQDIKDNKSTTIKGKIFCVKCNPLNELTSSVEASAAGGSAPGTAVSGTLLALLFLGVALALGASGYLFYDKQFASGPDARRAEERRIADVESSLRDLKTLVTALSGNVEDLRDLKSLPGQVDKMNQDLASKLADLEKTRKDVGAVQEGLGAVGALREKIDTVGLRQDESARSLGRLDAAIASIQKDLQTVKDRPPVIVAAAPDAAGTADPNAKEGAAADPAIGVDQRLLGLIHKLSAEDSMERWEAIDQIRIGKEKSLIPHVIKLLDDRDTFVRAQAVYTLGELKAMPAVTHLVRLLRDDETMIREEALTALVVITGQNLKFDVNSSKAEREKGIKRWEEWAAKNKDTINAGS